MCIYITHLYLRQLLPCEYLINHYSCISFLVIAAQHNVVIAELLLQSLFTNLAILDIIIPGTLSRKSQGLILTSSLPLFYTIRIG